MAETLRCGRCDADNQADARFCIDCGAPLIPPTTGPTTRLIEIECPNCRADNVSSARFCAVCGHGLDAEPSSGSRPTPGRPAAARPAAQPSRPRQNVRHHQGGQAMYCPVCPEITLVMTDRQGIEVDYCPQCRGVWLDRGELDKLIERSALAIGGSSRTNQQRDRKSDDDREHRDYDDDYRRKKKRRGFLDELFDFD
jgi:Zn-finger nucleic acid-binding protein